MTHQISRICVRRLLDTETRRTPRFCGGRIGILWRGQMKVVSLCLGVAEGYEAWTHQISRNHVLRLLDTPRDMSIFLL